MGYRSNGTFPAARYGASECPGHRAFAQEASGNRTLQGIDRVKRDSVTSQLHIPLVHCGDGVPVVSSLRLWADIL